MLKLKAFFLAKSTDWDDGSLLAVAIVELVPFCSNFLREKMFSLGGETQKMNKIQSDCC